MEINPNTAAPNDADMASENMRPSVSEAARSIPRAVSEPEHSATLHLLSQISDRLAGLESASASARSDGEAAAEHMQPSLPLLSEMHQRLAAVEASQASIHEKIDDATKAGALDPGLLERVAHVMQKYFPHDMVPTDTAIAVRPKFDAFTGAPLQ